MGLNSIKCDGYADVKESGFGKGNRTASDLNTIDIVTAAGMLALIGLASGCISLSKENVMKPLVKDGDFGKHVDAELKATK